MNFFFYKFISSFILPGAPKTTIVEYVVKFFGNSSPSGGLHISILYPLFINLLPISPGTEVFDVI